MKNLKSKMWWSAASSRAIKTMAQTFVALSGTNVVSITDLNLGAIISAMILSGLLSIATSIAGIPEIDMIENGPKYES